MSLRAAVRFLLPAAFAVLILASGLGLLTPAARTSDARATAVARAATQQLRGADAVIDAVDAAKREASDLVEIGAFGAARAPMNGLVPDARVTDTAARVDAVTDLANARRALADAAGGLVIPGQLRGSLRIVTSGTTNDTALADGTAHLDPKPFQDIVAWLTAQAGVARAERAASFQDLAHIQASDRSDRSRSLVGFELIIAALGLTVLLLVTWRRSRAFEQDSSRDALTNVANRRQLEQDVSVGIDDVAVLMIDIDHFKSLNDTQGHAAGDRALARVAQCISENVRSVDVVYRYGGEEFCALLPDADLQGATAIAERVRRAVEELRIDTDAGIPGGNVTVSIGVAVDRPRSGIEQADRALLTAKSEGRNRVMTAPVSGTQGSSNGV